MRRRLSVLFLVAAALGAMAPAVYAADPEPPQLSTYDAPFVRTPVVQLDFVQQNGSGGVVITRRASNDPATTNGVLTNGTTVAETGLWSLAAGPDGPRTVYGQFQFAGGAWSPVASLSLDLDTSPASSFYADRDAKNLLEEGFHQYMTDADTRFVARGQPAGAPDGSGFQVMGPGISVSLYTPGVSMSPGVYDATVNESGGCDAVCATVSTDGEGCLAEGTVTVHEIAFHDSGDVQSVSADNRLTCLPVTVFIGSVRYGSTADVVALGQDMDAINFGTIDVGEISEPVDVTFTNIGTDPNTFGEADFTGALTGDASTDYHVTADNCSGETLSVGESCDLSVSFEPTVRGLRHAALEIPDETSRGSRVVRLGAAATQPTTLALTPQDVPGFGPAEATFDVTVSPAGPGYPRLYVDGVQQFGPTEQTLENPSRRVTRYVVTLQPGHHEITTDFEGIDFMLSSTTDGIELDVGVKTTLELATSTDDGVATGEAAELKAQVWSGGAVTGTLRIRDGDTNAVLATGAVSGDDPSLVTSVTRGQGTHPFTAEFVPSSPTYQAANDAYDLEVVNGSRPETVMSSEPLYSTGWAVQGTFSTPTAGASLECRQGATSTVWFPCVSPYTWHWTQRGVVEVFVTARLPNGLADRTPASRLWYIDEDPPVTSAPTKRFITGSAIGGGRIPLRVTWSGSDAETGIASYQLDQSTNSGAFSPVATGLAKPTSDRKLAPQHQYRFGGRATDKAGNLSGNTAGGTFTLSSFSETHSRITYSGTWRKTSSSAYWGGASKYASARGAKATFTFTGTSFAWVGRKGPGRGKAEILVNGSKVATVDLYASSYQNYRVVWSGSWSTAAKRTITIRVLGTSGRPRVDLDALVTTN